MAFIKKIKRNGKTYLIKVESYREGGKIKHKYLGYIGKEADGKTILSSSISNVEIESVKVYGQLLVLHHLAQSIGLSDLLGDYGNEILSMVFAHCVEPKSLNQMKNWYKKTDLNFLLDLEHLTQSRLLDALDSLEELGFEDLQKQIFSFVKKKYKIDSSGILYDVTNTYLYGDKCLWGKKGRSKEGKKNKPLVQLGLGVTRKDGIPVFHKTFSGNIHDARTLQGILPAFKEFGIRETTFVYDRGIPSKENISDVKNAGWETICGIPIGDYLKPLVRKLIKEKKFVDFNNRVKLSKTSMYGVSTPYEINQVKGKLLICFNNKMKVAIQESRYDEIHEAQIRLSQNKNIKNGLKKYFDKKNSIIQKEIKKSEELDGYSIIFSTKKINNEEIIKIYFEKDLVEKAFKSLKGVIGLRPIRHWLYNRVEAHIFICYLSYLLLSLLQLKLKKINIGAMEALQELSTLYKVYMKDTKKGFEVTKLVKLTKKQEKILRAIDKRLLKV